MKHLAAYLLLTLSGNSAPSAEEIKEVLGSVGIDADEDRLAQLLRELSGRDVNEVIAEGSAKLATVGNAGVGSNGTVGGDEMGKDEKGKGEDPGDDGDGDGDEDEDEDEDFGLGLFG